MNTQALFCLSLPLVIAGCAQQTSVPSARDRAFAQGQQLPAAADIYQRSPEVTRSGRYTLVSVKSADAQREPLNQLIDITMPGQLVNTVGDGFRYLLFQSGYSLCGRYGVGFAALLNRPLPAVQRKIGPLRLSEALQIVAGPAWRMSVDEVNREVCFVLRDAYQSQVRSPVIPAATATQVSRETTRNPYTGVLPGNKPAPVVAGTLLPASGKKQLLPDSQSLPVPALRPAAVPVKPGTSPAAQAASVKTPSAPRNPFTGESLNSAGVPVSPSPVAGKSTATPSSVIPPASVAKTVVSPAVKAAPVTGTPVTAVTSGPEWKATAGTTLKESLTAWAGRADCPNGGHWVVIWQTTTDYRIDAPLVFKGSFESALVQVFDLYRRADKPLFAEASRLQCLVSVTDRPADRS
ncbi:hypothetical protein EJH27_01555 [Salmonella enterica subsp. enterica serovar Virchow]|nr:hypothetical protein [Salmonella enterica subsp. enterica serovar Virchow]